MKKGLRILLILVAVASFGIALSYPIRYRMEIESSDNTLDKLAAIRNAARQTVDEAEESPEDAPGAMPPEFSEGDTDAEAAVMPEEKAEGLRTDDGAAVPETRGEKSGAASAPAENESPAAPEGDAEIPEGSAQGEPQAIAGETSGAAIPVPGGTKRPNGGEDGSEEPDAAPELTPTPSPTPAPTPTINRLERTGAEPYPEKEKVELDVDRILPEYKEIYEMNPDFIGWIAIPGMNVDYPVVQTDDSEYYLKHDFFGDKNANGQIILDTMCDPYTPSYNLVISGHNMRSGKMFGNLVNYMYKSFWEKHKIVEFDTLMERKEYVVLAAFFSADYDVDEAGFRYNADIQYSIDLKTWMRDIKENQVYDTGIDTEFGDEFLTLTTCNKSRRNDGRFVVICRRIREGEEF